MYRITRYSHDKFLLKGTTVKIIKIISARTDQEFSFPISKEVYIRHQRQITSFKWDASYTVDLLPDRAVRKITLNGAHEASLLFDHDEVQKLKILIKVKDEWDAEEVEPLLEKSLVELKSKYRGSLSSSKFGI